MYIYPAIDIYDGKAVRLYRGDYEQMTVYSDDPPAVAEAFIRAGARRIHVVDLEGARDGSCPNFDTVTAVKAAAVKAAAMKAEEEAAAAKPAAANAAEISADGADKVLVEIGGGIRDYETVRRYLDAGIDRIILGTAAVRDPELLERCVSEFGDRIAVGIDVKDGYVAVKGWTELSGYRLREFARMMQDAGVRTIICTDISKDGAMRGTNRGLYRELSAALDVDIVASGGVSAIEDVRELAALGIHGAIIGRAYYTGAIDLAEAVAAAAEGGNR